MVRRSLITALLTMGLAWGVGHLAWSQATVSFTFVPASPAIGVQVTFTATVTEGDASWFVLYEWDFNQDGTYDANGRVVTHSFSSAGTKPVTLRAKDDRGGYQYVTQNVAVTNNPPVACFTYSPTYPNAGDIVQFDGACSTDSDGTIVQYAWTFDNAPGTGGTATGSTPRFTFTTSGQHPVTLTVTDSGGETDQITKFVSVQCVEPSASFTYSPTSPTVNNSIQFQDTSTDPDGGTILTWSWTFGDGGTSTQRHPTHQYTNGGSYTVTLTVEDNCEKTDTATTVVAVVGPSASFTYSPANPSTQDSVQFFDQSTGGSSDITSWSWNFGDSGGSSSQNPVHTFASAGTYRVQLTVTTRGGATSSAARSVTVLNAPPHASFTFSPANPKVSQMVTFSAAGSGDTDGSVVLYEWDFDEDGITDATGTTVTRAFSSVGAKTVMLTVTDNAASEDSVTRVVPVQGTPPTAAFTYTPTAPVTGQVISFSASTSADADGTIILYEWDFNGDGATDATGMSVTHSFASVGVYPVMLTVTDNDQQVGAETKGIPVSAGGTSGDNQAPVADFTITPAEGDEANLNEVLTFKADGSSDADGSIVAYEWDFDRDGIYDATGSTASFIYHAGGAKIVTLRVTDNEAAYGYKTRVVSVEFVRPQANFTYTPSQPEVDEIVTFDGSSSTDRDGEVEFYEWDFDDDGETDATGQSVNHVFSRGGSLPVTLIVTDDDGVTDYTTKILTVAVNSPPIAAFQVPSAPHYGAALVFTDESVDSDGEIVTWLWDFGDSTTSAIQTPSHTYTCADEACSSRTYTVTLTVTDNKGNTDDVSHPLSVTKNPVVVVASFTYTPTGPDKNEVVTFTDTSTPIGSIATWSWTFGDGGTSTAQNPTHTYEDSSTGAGYEVTLIVGTAGGDTGTITRYVPVGGDVLTLYAYPNPAASQAQIVCQLPDGAEDVVLRIYNLAGKLIVEVDMSAHDGTYEWDLTSDDGEDVANGMYFVLVTATVDGQTRRSETFRLLVARR
ncbi:MAG: PKD domain-containing protein [Candidatus Bipolaricaulota bacterium]|nr:PKD domain-containing protein [Candidatus Bipolaricaulota bacterium]